MQELNFCLSVGQVTYTWKSYAGTEVEKANWDILCVVLSVSGVHVL